MENQQHITPPVIITSPPSAKAKPEGTRRLTVDIPVSLHRRIKVKCAMEDAAVNEMVRKVLERAFPEPKVN
jgi:predicted HicB family RNase H-like nuclease